LSLSFLSAAFHLHCRLQTWVKTCDAFVALEIGVEEWTVTLLPATVCCGELVELVKSGVCIVLVAAGKFVGGSFVGLAVGGVVALWQWVELLAVASEDHLLAE
jgi:hypothetical protein